LKICGENLSFIKIWHITGTLHEDQYTFLVASCSLLLRVRNVSEKCCRQNQNTHFMFSNFFKKLCLYEMRWKIIIEPGRPQMTIWHMCTAFWIPKGTITVSVYVIVIAFPLQQLLHKCAMLCVHCLSCLKSCQAYTMTYLKLGRDCSTSSQFIIY
jgi:hypothetical protein